jgi:hypothetical protein
VTELDDISLKLKASKRKDVATYWARQLVQAQWEAGISPVPHLTNADFEKIVKLTVEQWEKDRE